MNDPDAPLLHDARPAAGFDVCAIGENSLDRVAVVDGLTAIGDKAPMLAYRELPGGQVATTALACARLGLRTAYLGNVGDDPAADAVLEPLRAAGVDLQGVHRVAGAATRSAFLLVDRKTGDRTVLWYRDPALGLVPNQLDRKTIEAARVLHIDASDPEAATWAADVARAAGVPVVLDLDAPAPGVGRLLTRVDFPIVSRGFAEGFSETRSVRDSLARLVAKGARLAVVTLGEFGALARQGDRTLVSPAFGVEPVDTTGAGDLFHAGFVWALLEGFGAERALRAANAAAALNCRALGAQGGLVDRRELLDFLATHEPRPWREPEPAPTG